MENELVFPIMIPLTKGHPMTIIPERLIEIESKSLRKGNGKSIDTACIMNMVSYIAGEPWSDHPKCACPVLTKIAIGLNDRMDDEQRQKLLPLIPLLVGTKGEKNIVYTRAKFIIWRNITITFPILLDLIGMTEYAAELRLTPQTTAGFQAAGKTLREKRGEIRVAARITATATDAADAYASAYAASAYAADAADAAYASASAYAYAAYADAADASASAAYVAADAASAAAYAADASAPAATDSRGKNLINDSAIETLRLACSLVE